LPYTLRTYLRLGGLNGNGLAEVDSSGRPVKPLAKPHLFEYLYALLGDFWDRALTYE
jgi:hypothetical protein